MHELMIRPCRDAALLAHMFKELAEDENTDTPRTDAQYRQCMEDFLESGESAYVFSAGDAVVGYALVTPGREPYYLRHFYIARSERRKGYGRGAFDLLLRSLGVDTIDLDVFVWNTRGIAFWTSLGFEPRCHMMRLKRSTP